MYRVIRTGCANVAQELTYPEPYRYYIAFPVAQYLPKQETIYSVVGLCETRARKVCGKHVLRTAPSLGLPSPYSLLRLAH